MYNLDSLTLKLFVEENLNFLNGAVIQKIQMPSKREILLSLRNLGENKKLYININPKYPHMCFIKEKDSYFLKIPKDPPMFCMLLRKYAQGSKIINVKHVEYERITEFYFESYDEIGMTNLLCLSIELMGKHSNAIIYDTKTNIILGCAHNISPEKSAVREVYGGIKYIYPPLADKKDILKTGFSTFYDIIKNSDLPLKKALSKHYYYLSEALLESILNNGYKDEAELFSLLQNTVSGKRKDIIENFWQNKGSVNNLIENYFSKTVKNDTVNGKKNKLEKIVNKEIKKLENICTVDKNADKYLKYKEKGDLIIQNIYKIQKGDTVFRENDITIDLDPAKSPQENAARYYNLYNKGKNAKNILFERQQNALKEKEYLQTVLFSVQNALSPDILDEIEDEINTYTKKTKSLKENKLLIETVSFEGFEIIIGKNNKQNDYIIKKLSHGEDIWLHAQNAPSGHVFIKTQNGRKKVPDSVLLYAAKIVKENSPLKDVSKASVIYTKRKFIKRPPDTNPGYVTYREEKEIIV